MIFGASTFILNSFLVKNLLKNLQSRNRLKSSEDRVPPRVLADLTLAVPVRNEEKNLQSFLPLLAQQLSLPEKILFLNDQSTDGTGQMLVNFRSQSGANMEILAGQPLPENFRGKVWALKQLLENVQTRYVLFMDADVRLTHARALFSLYEECHGIRQGRYSFASVFPRPKASNEASLLVNQIFVHLYYLLPAQWRTSDMGGMAAGCGQVMLINAEKLKEYGFLDQIASSTHDGLKLARLFKTREKTINYFDGGALIQSEYYATLGDAFKGFSRNSMEADSSALVAVGVSFVIFWAFILPFVFLPFAVLNPWWFAALFTILWGQYRLMQELDLSPLFIAATPVAASLSCAVHIWSAVKSGLHLREEWHGRFLG